MNKKIKQWQDEILRLKELMQKSREKVLELEKKIRQAEKEQELANNKMIADAVRAAYGEVTEANIEQFVKLIRDNGHRINGSDGKV